MTIKKFQKKIEHIYVNTTSSVPKFSDYLTWPIRQKQMNIFPQLLQTWIMVLVIQYLLRVLAKWGFIDSYNTLIGILNPFCFNGHFSTLPFAFLFLASTTMQLIACYISFLSLFSLHEFRNIKIYFSSPINPNIFNFTRKYFGKF